MLEEEFTYYKDNYKDLFAKYPNKFIVIKNLKVQFECETFEEALTKASSLFEIGTFLIQECTGSEDDFTQTIIINTNHNKY